MSIAPLPHRANHDGVLAEHHAFCAARQAMNQAFVTWLRADPTADFDSEIGPTLDVLRQLRDLEQMP